MLGDGTTNQQNSFQQVGNSTNWEFATIGEYHTVALENNSSLSTWGYNFYGQLGIGSNITSLTPIHNNCTADNEDFSSLNPYYIYPNPTKSVLNIQFSNAQLIQKLVINDVCGKIVMQQIGDLPQIDVQSMETGLYILTIYTQDKVYKEKFIKD